MRQAGATGRARCVGGFHTAGAWWHKFGKRSEKITEVHGRQGPVQIVSPIYTAGPIKLSWDVGRTLLWCMHSLGPVYFQNNYFIPRLCGCIRSTYTVSAVICRRIRPCRMVYSTVVVFRGSVCVLYGVQKEILTFIYGPSYSLRIECRLQTWRRYWQWQRQCAGHRAQHGHQRKRRNGSLQYTHKLCFHI